ncbi:MAG: phytoene desaturase family protein [Archangium sp.]
MKRVAVIGGGFGGLAAAAELAHAGHRVTLFEKSNTLGGKAQVVTGDGLTLDTGPTLLTMPDVVRALFARIGASDLLPKFTRLSLQARYTWKHDARVFECHEDLERTVASAAQFGPKEAGGARSFFAEAERLFAAAGGPYLEAPFENMPEFLARVIKHVGPLGMLTGMKLSTLDGLATSHFHSPQLRQFVNRFATYAGCSPYLATAAFALIPHLERAQGVHHVEGGMAALVKALGLALERLGVELRLGEEVRWTNQRVVADQQFDSVIVNADPFAHEPLGTRPLALSGYVALLDVKRRLPLAHHHVVFGGDYVREFDELFAKHTVPSDPTVYFCHPAATDPTVAPEGRSGLFAMVNAPAMRRAEDVDAWKQQHAAAMRQHCLDALKQLVPGLRDDEVTLLAERTPVELAQRGAPGGSIYGFLPHGPFGPFQRPKIKSTTPGVFFAGGSTHPGGGVPMVLLSGHFAATMASTFLGSARAAA